MADILNLSEPWRVCLVALDSTSAALYGEAVSEEIYGI